MGTWALFNRPIFLSQYLCVPNRHNFDICVMESAEKNVWLDWMNVKLTSALFNISHLLRIFIAYTFSVPFIFTTATWKHVHKTLREQETIYLEPTEISSKSCMLLLLILFLQKKLSYLNQDYINCFWNCTMTISQWICFISLLGCNAFSINMVSNSKM